MLKNSYPLITAIYLALCIFFLRPGRWNIYYLCICFTHYSAWFYHHFFQVSFAVSHLSNKMGHFSVWSLGGWLSLSICVRILLIWTSKRKTQFHLQGPMWDGVCFVWSTLQSENHCFFEEGKDEEVRESHDCTSRLNITGRDGMEVFWPDFYLCMLSYRIQLRSQKRKDVQACWK